MKYLMMAIFLFVVGSTSSQLKERDNLLGISLGFWPTNNAPVLGVNYENQVTQAGIGTIGLGGLFRYYTYGVTYSNGDSRRYNFSSFGMQANYNFNQIGDGKFVPSFGLVLGYNSVNSSYTDVRGNAVYISDITYTSGAWLWAQAGFRYFFSNSVAGGVRIGFGNNNFNTLELGLDFKL
ncbi:MAG TPA: hypothetical protein VJ455_11925 [Ignavibacteria bacterium]|nr:hypothetical protein [Ignavibacteria bacterium]